MTISTAKLPESVIHAINRAISAAVRSNEPCDNWSDAKCREVIEKASAARLELESTILITALRREPWPPWSPEEDRITKAFEKTILDAEVTDASDCARVCAQVVVAWGVTRREPTEAAEAARKEAEDSLDHERIRHSETQAELDEIGRILDERYRLLKVRHDALAATVERARRMLTCIRDDNRGGRGEISYDEFSYKRREAELQDAARMALVAIDATPEPQPRLTDEMVEAAARELDWSNDWTGQRIDEVREGDPGGLSLKTARRILEAAERVR